MRTYYDLKSCPRNVPQTRSIDFTIDSAFSKTLCTKSYISPRNSVFDEVEIPRRKEQFYGVVRPIDKHWESLMWCMQQKDHSVLNNGTTAKLLQPTAMLTTGWCHIILAP